MNIRPTERAPIKRPARAREMQDALNHYIYHPLAWQLARALAPTPLTPNMVSVFGGLLVVAAGAVYFTTSGPLWAILGMALHLSWHVVDGADGDLARITGKTSPLGELVDGICDYVSHIVLYVLLSLRAQSGRAGRGSGPCPQGPATLFRPTMSKCSGAFTNTGPTACHGSRI